MAKKIIKKIVKKNTKNALKNKKATIVDIKKVKTSKAKKIKKQVDYMIPLESKSKTISTSASALDTPRSKIEHSEDLSQPVISSQSAQSPKATNENTSNESKQSQDPQPLGTLASIDDEEKQSMGTKTALFGSKKTLNIKPVSTSSVLPKLDNNPSTSNMDINNTQKSSVMGSLESIDDDKNTPKPVSANKQLSQEQSSTTTDNLVNTPDLGEVNEKKEKTEEKQDFFVSNIDSGDMKIEGDTGAKSSQQTNTSNANETDKQKSTNSSVPANTKSTQQAVTAVQKTVAQKNKKKSFWDFLTKSYGKSDSEFIIQNLALFLTSGINIMTSLDAMRGETKNKNLQNSINELKSQIEDGTPIWRALRNLDLASENTVALIRIGEESGKLTENLNVIANQQLKDRSFRSKVLSAMLYPVLVMGMTVVVGLGIAWFILPRLASVFSSMKMQLPWITKAVIWIGKFLSVWGLVAVPGIIIFLGLIFYFVFVYSKTKHIGQAILFQIPGIKDLLMQVEITRFGYVLGTLLDAGIPIGTALGSLKESTTTQSYRKIYEYFTKGIEEGNSFQKCFQSYPKIEKYIPVPVQQMIIASEQTGTLGVTLKKVGEMYEEKTDFSTKNLATIIEPILLFIVWAAVLIVALAVIIPIYGLVGGMNQAAKQTTSTAPVETNAPEAIEDTESPTEPIETENAVPTISPTPTISTTPSASPEATKKVKILSTETGFLNVRSDPSTSGTIVGTVNPGDEYTYTNIENDWYQIKVSDTVTGWVSGEYVEIVQ